MANRASRQRAEEVEEARRLQPLRRHVDQVQRTLAHRPLDRRSRARKSSVELSMRGAHAELGQRRHLVVHQRDQRRDHDGEPVEAQGRHLVAERLAAAGRHQHEPVAAGEDVADHLLLQAAKRGVAPDGRAAPRAGRAAGARSAMAQAGLPASCLARITTLRPPLLPGGSASTARGGRRARP